MRRSTATVVAAVLIAAGVGAGTTAAIGASGGSPPSAKSQANAIAASLGTSSGRAHYGLADGHLVAADVCVRGTCVHRQFQAAPACSANTACIGSALVLRRFAHGVTISAEIA